MRVEGLWANDNNYLLGGNDLYGHYMLGNDDQFTNDFGLKLDSDVVNLMARQRMVTEHLPMRANEHLRTDQVDAAATFVQPLTLAPEFALRFSETAGATGVGNFGGLAIQTAVHKLPFVHARLPGSGLQDTYEGSTRIGLTLGLGAGLDFSPASFATLSADVSGQDTFGTGLAQANAKLSAFMQLPENPTCVRPFVNASLSAIAQQANDVRLNMPGGYTNGVYVQPALQVGVDAGPVRAAYAMRANEGGSGQGTGEFTLGFTI